MSVSEGRQIERRPNRFTITWAQIIDKFRVERIAKNISDTICTDLSDGLLLEGHLVRRNSGSVFSPISLLVALKVLLSGSETKSSETRQITVIHTIIRKMCKD